VCASARNVLVSPLSGESGPGTSGDSSRCAIMGPRLRGGHLTSSQTALLMPVTSLPTRRRRSPAHRNRGLGIVARQGASTSYQIVVAIDRRDLVVHAVSKDGNTGSLAEHGVGLQRQGSFAEVGAHLQFPLCHSW